MRPSSGSSSLVGQLIAGRYAVSKKIGAGAMGAVFEALDQNTEQRVAIKILHSVVSGDQQIAERFKNEAKIISELRHPNTLKLLDLGALEDGGLYIVTEYLHGEALNTLYRQRSLDLKELVHLMIQICGSLEEAHDKGVVHRDLKPGNVFVEFVGEQRIAKVLDFGIAKLTHQTRMTATGQIFGTPAYMSPEQASGVPADHRSDIYSLGVILYEGAAGQLPFQSEVPAALLLKHIQEPPPPFSEQARAFVAPPALEELVMWMLDKEREERPQTVSAVASKLKKIERLLDTESSFPEVGARPAPRPLAPLIEAPETAPDVGMTGTLGFATDGSSHRLRLAGLILVLLAAGIVGFAAFSRSKPSSETAVLPIAAPVVAEKPAAAVKDAGVSAPEAVLDAGTPQVAEKVIEKQKRPAPRKPKAKSPPKKRTAAREKKPRVPTRARPTKKVEAPTKKVEAPAKKPEALPLVPGLVPVDYDEE